MLGVLPDGSIPPGGSNLIAGGNNLVAERKWRSKPKMISTDGSRISLSKWTSGPDLHAQERYAA